MQLTTTRILVAAIFSAITCLPALAADARECNFQARYLDTILFDARKSVEILGKQPIWLDSSVSPEASAAGQSAKIAQLEAARAMTEYVQALEDTTYQLRVCARPQ